MSPYAYILYVDSDGLSLSPAGGSALQIIVVKGGTCILIKWLPRYLRVIKTISPIPALGASDAVLPPARADA